MRLKHIAIPTLSRRLGLPIMAIAVTVVIASLLAMVAGGNPFSVLGLIINGAFGSKFALLGSAEPDDPVDLYRARRPGHLSRQILEHRR